MFGRNLPKKVYTQSIGATAELLGAARSCSELLESTLVCRVHCTRPWSWAPSTWAVVETTQTCLVMKRGPPLVCRMVRGGLVSFTSRNHRPHSLTTSEVGAIGSTKNEETFFCRLHKQSAKLMINVFCFV